jgi:ubiquitin-protein ligase
MAAALPQQRLLRDIKELQTKPYPGIALHLRDGDLTQACLILTPEGNAPLHLTVIFEDRYPIQPPQITIQSKIAHPNIYNDYICASILNTTEGYTPAYTLKGICIQLLSFFGSDKLEQDHGGVVDLKDYTRDIRQFGDFTGRHQLGVEFSCTKCGFINAGGHVLGSHVSNPTDDNVPSSPMQLGAQPLSGNPNQPFAEQERHLWDLPDELLVSITEFMEEETLFSAARAWNGFSRLLQSQNLIQVREMQCFTLKEGFKQCCLGVGIGINGRKLQSEFDYISKDAFQKLGVRTSVQGIPFSYWLPLPFSESHWKRVKADALASLESIGRVAGISGPAENVLYAIMNDVTVKLCEATSGENNASNDRRSRWSSSMNLKSTLTHASEKAVESYYQLYHLLVTLATDNPEIAAESSRCIKAFMDGDRSKTNFPNLGHLLVAMLISDATTTSDLTTAIIKEAITRNVVWMLDSRGAGMAELSYLEPSEISEYRLTKTYEVSKTSFNLLMFAHLMRKTASQPAAGIDGPQSRTLQDVREELFSRHGSPPAGTAAALAASIRSIREVKSFPCFLQNMEVPVPRAAESTRFLRRSVEDSMAKGYSTWAFSQERALALRLREEPDVEVVPGMRPSNVNLKGARFTFFPQNQKRKADGSADRGGRGDRGNGRGRGRGRGGF